MKRLYLAILICLGVSLLEAQTLHTSQGSKPVLKFATTEFDFGKIKENAGAVSHDFEFTNTGSAPLVIVRIVTSCTCTKADFSKKPIAPAEKSVVKITYDPNKQGGVFYKAIQVYSNSAEGRTIITAKGEVINDALKEKKR